MMLLFPIQLNNQRAKECFDSELQNSNPPTLSIAIVLAVDVDHSIFYLLAVMNRSRLN